MGLLDFSPDFFGGIAHAVRPMLSLLADLVGLGYLSWHIPQAI